MILLAVAVTCVAALSVVNVMLTIALARRLREHAEASSNIGAFGPLTLPNGSPAPEFAATSANGASHSLTDLRGSPSLVAFLGASCPGCRTQLSRFVDLALTVPGGPAHVLCVIAGREEEGRDLQEAVADVATIILEPDQGPVSEAFSVRALPTFYVLDRDARVEVAGTRVPEFDFARAKALVTA